jgi:hypothetical protein
VKCCACGAVCVISRAIAGCVAGGALHRDQKIKQNKNGMGVQWVAEQSRAERRATRAHPREEEVAKGVTVLTSHRHTTCMAAVVYVGLPPPPVPAPRYSLAPIR